MTTAAFSKSGKSCPEGKCTESLRAMVPEDVKADFAVAARMLDKPNISEHLRDVVLEHLYGAVQPDMQPIVWEHIEREIKSEFLINLLRNVIFGRIHEISLELEQQSAHGVSTLFRSRRASDAH
jgi:hypothetical protein